MSLKKLPEIRADHRLAKAGFDLRPDAVDRWEPAVCAKAGDDAEASISIYDSIGENWEGTGITSKRISAALRSIGAKDVVVNINSPGGDFFEGMAIYNLLREHQGKVTVRVLGVAASVASVIAMAGDEILIGDGAFFMIHNAWAVAVGNRHDMLDSAKLLEPFDAAMAALYAHQTGMSTAEAATMMDKETWIGAQQAVDDGFATGLLPSSEITKSTQASTKSKPLALIEASMAKAGFSRTHAGTPSKPCFLARRALPKPPRRALALKSQPRCNR
jgi:ATP-dependent protease ClpP protease subunit